jgi:hypothetical protein
MSTATKLDQATSREKKALQSLITRFTQSGPEDKKHLAPIIVMMLRENPRQLNLPEGRELLSAVREHIDWKQWGGALSAEPPSKEFVRVDKLLNEYFDAIEAGETWPPENKDSSVWP